MNYAEFGSTFLSGLVGGVGVVAAGQPFDTVKIKMQTFPELYEKMGPTQDSDRILPN
jgi:hypothetical protein